jgi:hypothetical protein
MRGEDSVSLAHIGLEQSEIIRRNAARAKDDPWDSDERCCKTCFDVRVIEPGVDNPGSRCQKFLSVPGDILQLGRQLLHKNFKSCAGQRLVVFAMIGISETLVNFRDRD